MINDDFIKMANKHADRVAMKKQRKIDEMQMYEMVNLLNRKEPIKINLNVEQKPKPITWIGYWIIAMLGTGAWSILMYVIFDIMKFKGWI